MADPVKTTCPYCGTGCGVLAKPDGAIVGDPDHPANAGRLCSKGAALGETLGLETRLLYPEIDGRRVGWDEATEEIATRIRETIASHGAQSVAFYLSGQLLTEDYYAVNKLAKGFLGTAHVDTNSRLCMASTVAGHRRAFGSDTVAGCYEDIEVADLVVVTGSNLAWCHPVLFQRLRAAREMRGTKVVVIDPRRTETCDIADLHLALKPGSDVALFNGLLAWCAETGALDHAYISAHVSGFEMPPSLDLAEIAATCDLPVSEIEAFYTLFAATPRTVTLFSQGVNQSSAGTDKVNAILNVHLATGRIGKPGAAPFSVTGQPNAMGGREVGGLANQLAAHMGFDATSIDRVRRFWRASYMAETEGLKAVEMFRAIADGRIRFLWIMGTNPAVSLPDAGLVRKALAKCPTVVVSDCVSANDTLPFAHIRLPALPWSEKDGTVTNSERMISRQRAFRPAAGEARPDWSAAADVARALGFADAFGWAGPGEIFREHAALTAFENGGTRDLDLSHLVDVDYDRMAPTFWGGERPFADGRFFTPDGRARFVPVAHRPPRRAVTPDFPFVLNTGRYRDHWHTMTRTGLSARLSGHRAEPFLEVHPADATANGLGAGKLAQITSERGTLVARVRLEEGQRRGEIFLPMHWSDQFASAGVIGRLVPPETDPISGQPESKHIPARIAPFRADWTGFLLSRSAMALPGDVAWWVRRQGEGAIITEIAGIGPGDGLARSLDDAFGAGRLDLVDATRGTFRHAWERDGRLVAVLYVARTGMPDAAIRLASRIGEALTSPIDRLAMLAGISAHGAPDAGATVCSCFSVGLKTLQSAIAGQKLTSIAEIGAALKAGTGCGSCIPELRRLLPTKELAHELQA
jgi:assimilatory nitrate reductase catalytic subunit